MREMFIWKRNCVSRSGTHGGVAQLGEHLPCKQGVRGSNPLISIRKPVRGLSEAEAEEEAKVHSIQAMIGYTA